MNEIWMVILGLLLFGCFIWWITTGSGFWADLARSGERPSRGLKAALWIAYAVTALFVLSNSSCEGPDELGQHQEPSPHRHANVTEIGQGRTPGGDSGK